MKPLSALPTPVRRVVSGLSHSYYSLALDVVAGTPNTILNHLGGTSYAFYVNLTTAVNSSWTGITYAISGTPRAGSGAYCSSSSSLTGTVISPGYIRINGDYSATDSDGCLFNITVRRGSLSGSSNMVGTFISKPMSISSATYGYIKATASTLFWAGANLPTDSSAVVGFSINFSPDTSLSGATPNCPANITSFANCVATYAQGMICNVDLSGGDGCFIRITFSRYAVTPTTTVTNSNWGYLIANTPSFSSVTLYGATTGSPYAVISGSYLPRGFLSEGASVSFSSPYGLTVVSNGNSSSCSYSSTCNSPQYFNNGSTIVCSLTAPLSLDGCFFTTSISRKGLAGTGSVTTWVLRVLPSVVPTPSVGILTSDNYINITVGSQNQLPFDSDTSRQSVLSYTISADAPCSGASVAICQNNLAIDYANLRFRCYVQTNGGFQFNGAKSCALRATAISHYGYPGEANNALVGVIVPTSTIFLNTPSRGLLAAGAPADIFLNVSQAVPDNTDPVQVNFAYVGNCGAPPGPCTVPVISSAAITCSLVLSPSDDGCVLTAFVTRFNRTNPVASIGRLYTPPSLDSSQAAVTSLLAGVVNNITITGTSMPKTGDSFYVNASTTGCSVQVDGAVACTSPKVLVNGTSVTCSLNLVGVLDVTCVVSVKLTRFVAASNAVTLVALTAAPAPVAAPVQSPTAEAPGAPAPAPQDSAPSGSSGPAPLAAPSISPSPVEVVSAPLSTSPIAQASPFAPSSTSISGAPQLGASVSLITLLSLIAWASL